MTTTVEAKRRTALLPLSGALLVAAGIALNVAGDRQFRAARTPMHPDARPAALVISGVFRISRNPMYLGIVLLVLGVAMMVNRAIALVVPPALGILLHARFIRPEERRTADVFGADYRATRRACDAGFED
jgi:protein-S-isoprenylcysteine O-methyltransferase Ste14